MGQTSVKKATNLSIKVKKVTKSDKLVKKKDTNLWKKVTKSDKIVKKKVKKVTKSDKKWQTSEKKWKKK